MCLFCGKNNHSNAGCRTRTSEFTNNQNRPYVGSEAHGRLVKATGDRDWIPNFKELQELMSKAGQSSDSTPSAAKTSKPSKDWKNKCTYVSTILPIKLQITTSPNLLPVVLTFVSQEEAKENINVDALLDTGCLAGDFVARRIVDRFNIRPEINSAAKLSVCSGLDNTCYDISESASLVRESEQLSRAPLYDDDDIDHNKTDTFKPWSSPSSNNDILSLIHFSGDEDLQSRLRTLCTEFSDIFSIDLPKEPSSIPPFNLIADNLKWKVGKNRAPPRT